MIDIHLVTTTWSKLYDEHQIPLLINITTLNLPCFTKQKMVNNGIVDIALFLEMLTSRRVRKVDDWLKKTSEKFGKHKMFNVFVLYVNRGKCNLFVKYNKNSNVLLKYFWGMKKEKTSQLTWSGVVWRHLSVSFDRLPMIMNTEVMLLY